MPRLQRILLSTALAFPLVLAAPRALAHNEEVTFSSNTENQSSWYSGATIAIASVFTLLVGAGCIYRPPRFLGLPWGTGKQGDGCQQPHVHNNYGRRHRAGSRTK